ncbi:SWIM zinc finger family protein [Micromonospora echinospora]
MKWLTETALRRRAGARIFERGSLCVANVSGLAEEAGTVTATVTSSARSEVSYRIRLYERDGETAGDCDCPYGLEGHFCKHCVAAGLKLIGGSCTQQTPSPPEVPRHQEQWSAIEAFLAGRQPYELAELLRDAAHTDPALRHRLWLLATASDPAQLQEQAKRLRKRYGAGEGAAYAEQSRTIVFALGHQPAAHHADAQEGLRLVLRRLLDAIDRDPDHDGPGEATADDDEPVREVLSVAWRQYVRLCRITPPDPVQLAQWFVDVRLGHPRHRHCFPASDLAPSDGVLAACRTILATTEGEPAQKQALQEEVLEAAGDTDGHVALLAANLSTYRTYARIAEVLVAADRTEEAIGWLERARNPGVTPADDPRPVAELLASLYTRQGRLLDALQVRRRHFASARTETAYRALREAAGTAGVDWPPLRDEALDLLRRTVGPGLPPDDQGGWVMTTGPYAGSAHTLVHLLLEEGAPDEAWDVARRHRCQGSTLVKAAHARAVSYPEDAVGVYWSLVDQALEFHGRDRNRSYERVASLLFILKDLVTRSGGDFRRELAEFRATHSRKRNLMEELTRRGL